MDLIETTVTATHIHMRYADQPDATKAEEWIDIRVPLHALTLPANGREYPLGDPSIRHLASIQQAALRRARDVIGDETQRLANLTSRIA